MAELHLGVAIGPEGIAGFERPVVIKRILPHLARDQRLVQLFVSEAKLSTLLNHQNIVSTLDVGRDADGLFIVMERVEGWDLGAVLEAAAAAGKPFPPQLAAYVAGQIMSGLCYAYRRTQDGRPVMAAHRDVSGSNVLLSREGEVKVADFGIAPFDDAVEVSEASHLKGKIAYCAPELLRREPASPLSDQFSVGVLLFEMLKLRHPYGKLHNVMEYLRDLRTAAPPELTDVPRALASVVKRALHPRKEKRFPRPEDLAKKLTELSPEGSGAAELSRFLASLPLRPPLATSPTSQAQQAQQAQEDEPAQDHPPGFPFDQEWKPFGPQLDSSGQLEGVLPKTPSWAPASGAPLLAAQLQSDTQLELARPVPVSGENGAGNLDVVPEPPLYSRRRSKVPKLLFYLAVSLVLAAWTYWDQLGPTYEKYSRILKARTETELAGPAAPILRIESEPPGAHVTINGREIGTTPLFQENLFPRGQIEVTLSRRGYLSWVGSFEGGANATVEAQLARDERR